jgi:hypothetical protein
MNAKPCVLGGYNKYSLPLAMSLTPGGVAKTADEAYSVAKATGSNNLVIKAQVHTHDAYSAS